jgi:hypothetical protein
VSTSPSECIGRIIASVFAVPLNPLDCEIVDCVLYCIVVYCIVESMARSTSIKCESDNEC